MLSKKEKAVMKAIYVESVKKNGTCLMRPIDILKNMTYKIEFPSEELTKIIKDLELDDYYEVIDTEKKGEKLYCFTLHQKGYAFSREILNEKRLIYWKIGVSVAVALGVFFFKLILDAIAGR